MFSDQYIDKEENSKVLVSSITYLLVCICILKKKREREDFLSCFILCYVMLTFLNYVHNFLQDVLIRALTSDEIKLNPIDAEDPEVSSYSYTCIS